MELLQKILTFSITPVLVSIFYFLSLSVYRKDKKLLQKDIDNIKTNLTNHVTGTEKKIDQLRIDMNAKFEKTDSKIDQLRTDMHTKTEKTDSKIDQLRTDMHTKIDSNFNNILTVLNLSKQNESTFKRNNK